jgi:hypothetical protein
MAQGNSVKPEHTYVRHMLESISNTDPLLKQTAELHYQSQLGLSDAELTLVRAAAAQFTSGRASTQKEIDSAVGVQNIPLAQAYQSQFLTKCELGADNLLASLRAEVANRIRLTANILPSNGGR